MVQVLGRYFTFSWKPPMLPPCIDSSPTSKFEEHPLPLPPPPPKKNNVLNTCGKPCAVWWLLTRSQRGFKIRKAVGGMRNLGGEIFLFIGGNPRRSN